MKVKEVDGFKGHALLIQLQLHAGTCCLGTVFVLIDSWLLQWSRHSSSVVEVSYNSVAM